MRPAAAQDAPPGASARVPGIPAPRRRWRAGACLLLALGLGGGPAAGAPPGGPFPSILLISVDTLRADRLSAYGYPRPTSPHLDRLLAQGARFTEARTVEPLTGPAMASVLTSLHPHQHGATRNGLPLRSGLSSLPLLLAGGGYRTAAFVGNWTLRDRFTRLGAHFQVYAEVFSRKRWLGLFNQEATGEDLTAEVLAWVEAHRRREKRQPFFAWVHYVEPHAPYRFHKELAPGLGIPLGETPERADRYATEVAFVDRELGRLLAGLGKLGLGEPGRGENLLVIFTADHGESLGEHGYWGHGRHLYEEELRIPLGFVWPGKVPPGATVEGPALLLDIAPTVLGLLGLAVPGDFVGYDWSPVLTGRGEPPTGRTTTHQAHRGASHRGEDRQQQARERGLVELALIRGREKEVLRVKGDWLHRRFDLATDPGELAADLPPGSSPSPELLAWFLEVQRGLHALPDLDPEDLDLDPATIERLKALGYVD